MIIRRVHKYLALIFWGFSLLTLTTGMLLFIDTRLEPLETAQYKKLVWIDIGLMVGITLAFEIYF